MKTILLSFDEATEKAAELMLSEDEEKRELGKKLFSKTVAQVTMNSMFVFASDYIEVYPEDIGEFDKAGNKPLGVFFFTLATLIFSLSSFFLFKLPFKTMHPFGIGVSVASYLFSNLSTVFYTVGFGIPLLTKKISGIGEGEDFLFFILSIATSMISMILLWALTL